MFMLNVDSVADDVRTEDCSGFYCHRNTKRSVADYSEIKKHVFFYIFAKVMHLKRRPKAALRFLLITKPSDNIFMDPVASETVTLQICRGIVCYLACFEMLRLSRHDGGPASTNYSVTLRDYSTYSTLLISNLLYK